MGRKHKNNKINDIGAAALAAVFVLGLNYAKV